MTDTRLVDARTRWGGALVSIGSIIIVIAIALYVGGGAVAPTGATTEEMAETVSAARGPLMATAIISILADFVVAWGAFLLLGRPEPGARRFPVTPFWIGLALSMLLTLQFNLLIPYGILPLADAYAEAPVLFATLYRSSNLIHNVGLLFGYVCCAGIFWGEARREDRVISRTWAWIGTGIWTVSIIGAIGLIIERPPLMLAPLIPVAWLLLGVLGARLAFRKPAPHVHAAVDTAARETA